MSKQKTSDVIDSIVTADLTEAKHPAQRRPVILLMLGVAVLCVAIIFTLLFSTHDKKPKTQPVPVEPGQSVSGQVYDMDEGDLQKLTNEKVDPGKDIDRAHAKAVALSRQGDSKGSVRLYRAIVDSNKKTPYYVYYDYAIALAQAGDVKGAARVMKQAITTLKQDATVDTDTKSALLRLYNNKLVGFEEE